MFAEYLSEPGSRLVTIGYGWLDEHITGVIKTGVRQNGLKLFVIDPVGGRKARQLNTLAAENRVGALAKTPLEETFERGLYGASSRGLSEIFGGNQREHGNLMRFVNCA